MWVVPGQLGTAPSYGQMAFETGQRRNRWLPVVSVQPGVEAPIRITQDATLRVGRIEGEPVVATFAPRRYGFLFVAGGSVAANGEPLRAGDAVRLYDVDRLIVEGRGELVLWDTPEVTL